MRASKLFFHTLRDAPTEADFASHKLLLRGSFIKGLAAGIFDYLPLGLRVKRRLEAVMREEMEAVGFQEVLLPVVQPAELWQRTGPVGRRLATTWRAFVTEANASFVWR